MKKIVLIICSGLSWLLASGQPVSLLPENPHYFLYKNKPLILITSAEHYGAVVNCRFDYNKYFDWLALYGMNYTRIYPGYLTEPPDKWIKRNTLGLRPEEVIMPWKRSTVSGYAMGGNRFDLDRWDDSFFERLKDFVESAARRDIIVEMCFFNAQYEDCWPLCPLFYKNNVQGVGNCHFNDAQTLKDIELLRRESDYVAKIVQEVNKYDNVILEICDEPTINGTPPDEAGKWLDHMIDVVIKTEDKLPKKHLVAQQVEGTLNGPCDFSADKRISVITCQYDYWASGEQLGGLNGLRYKYQLNKPVELNETYYFPLWYKGDSIADSRVEAWEFIVGGGSAFNHLNGRYTVDNPAGNTPDNQKLCTSLKALREFITGFNYIEMNPDKKFISGGIGQGTFYRGMSQPGKQYALYMHHSNCTSDSAAYIASPGSYRNTLELGIPEGRYKAEWIDPETGDILKKELLLVGNKKINLSSPLYSIDIALRIRRI